MTEKKMPTLTKHKRQLLAEGILIVVSILLAFAIDASWNERLRRQDQQRTLRALEQDFEAASELLSKVSLAHKNGVGAGEALLIFTGPQATSIDSDRLADLLPPLFRIPYFSPSLGALEALLSSGDLRLIASAELRAALASFPVALAGLNRTQDYGAQFVLGHFLPSLAPHIPLRRYGMTSRGKTSFTGDIGPLLRSLEFENQVHVRLMNHELALTAVTALGERITDLLEMLALERSK